MAKPVLLGGAVMAVVGLVLHIVGTATPAWDTGTQSGLEVDIGPWQTCVVRGSASICTSNYDVSSLPGDIKGDIYSVRATTVLGAVCGAGACAVGVLMALFSVMGKDIHKALPIMCGAATGAAFGVIIAGVIVWASNIHSDGADFGYSFFLSIVGGVKVFAGGLLASRGARA